MARYYLSAFSDEADKDLAGQIDALHENGIFYSELRGFPEGHIDTLATGTVKRIHDAFRSEGIGVSALGSRLGKTEITEPFLPSLETLKRLVELCGILECPRIRMFSYFIPEGESPANYRGEVTERLAKLADYAAGQGVKLFHENEARIFGEQPENVLAIHEAVPALGGVYDPSNYRMADADLDFALEKVMPHVDYLHIKDCTADKAIVPAGTGDGRVREAILRHDALFSGESFLTLEPHLFIFVGYNEIDKHKLKHKLHFENKRESFACAAKALKGLLDELGFREGKDHVWTK